MPGHGEQLLSKICWGQVISEQSTKETKMSKTGRTTNNKVSRGGAQQRKKTESQGNQSTYKPTWTGLCSKAVGCDWPPYTNGWGQRAAADRPSKSKRKSNLSLERQVKFGTRGSHPRDNNSHHTSVAVVVSWVAAVRLFITLNRYFIFDTTSKEN